MKQIEVKMISNPMPNKNNGASSGGNINIVKDGKNVAGANAENTAKSEKQTMKKRNLFSTNKTLEFPNNMVMKIMCRPSIMFIQFFNLVLAVLLFFTWFLYTGFVTWQRPFTIIFLIFSTGFFITFCYAKKSLRSKKIRK